MNELKAATKSSAFISSGMFYEALLARLFLIAGSFRYLAYPFDDGCCDCGVSLKPQVLDRDSLSCSIYAQMRACDGCQS